MNIPTRAASSRFRHALGAFASGVTIVTTRERNGSDVGLTASSFNSVSLHPPMVLWSLSNTARSLPAFNACRYFGVHILSIGQRALAELFATRGADKFADLQIERGLEEIPLLPGCTARFQCRTAFRYEVGDHVMFVGEVIEFDHLDLAPLVFHRSRYASVGPDVD